MSYDTLDSVGFILSTCGISLWGIAAAQSVYLDYYQYRNDAKHAVLSNTAPFLSPSSHSMINAALYLSSASAYIAVDLRSPSEKKDLFLCSIASSVMWIKGTLVDLLTAIMIERNKEKHPNNDDIRLCGMSNTYCYLFLKWTAFYPAS